jgi:hypothetical protein
MEEMTKSNSKKAARKAAEAAGPAAPAEPRSAQELYEWLARSVATQTGAPKRCGEARCRRNGRCLGATMSCTPVGPPLTPEEDAEFMAELRQAILADQRRRELV